jgi:exoribonuclease-2
LASEKPLNFLVEYLHGGQLRPALAVGEQGNQVTVVEAGGHERRLTRDVILIRYPERRATRDNLKTALTLLQTERDRLRQELDLQLLWAIVQEDRRGYDAEYLAETFFGRRGGVETAVMLEALLNDRLYFVRRHMEFVPRDPTQVERLRVQNEQIQLRSENGRQRRRLLSMILDGEAPPAGEDLSAVIADLQRYLTNPFARNRDTVALLEAVAGTLAPGEAAYEILDHLGASPPGPRFVLIGGLRTTFSDEALSEARTVSPPSRPTLSDPHVTVTIDDDETVEIDDAIGGERRGDGGFRVWVHIALLADFIARGSAMDREAAARGTTVYLPEASVRMVPDAISTAAASLKAGTTRHVLTTAAEFTAEGELEHYAIYAEQVPITARLTYEQADRMLAGGADNGGPEAAALTALAELAGRLRERRRRAGAFLVQRREHKVTVRDGEIQITVIDPASVSRELVAELMVLSNHLAGRSAAERGIPMIYRVQPNGGDDGLMQRPRLSLYPEFHAGVGLACYVQVSSPIRRYVDLVLQRQLLALLVGEQGCAYQREELMNVLAAAENVEAEGRDLERRARRYWTLRYLQSGLGDRPLSAIVTRDGGGAELEAYGVRGALRGAPNLAPNTRIAVRVARVDPLRGLLGLTYLRTLAADEVDLEEGPLAPH